MAAMLKRQHQLVAITASLARVERRTMVRLALESHEKGEPRVVGRWDIEASEFGLPARLEQHWWPDVRLPATVAAAMAEAVESLGLDPEHPLWLHLVKPYGHLGVVPWEPLLTGVLQRPLLRLPDFLEPPRERRDTLDVAILCSSPTSEVPIDAVDVVERMGRRLLAESPRRDTRVHCFIDGARVDEARARVADDPRLIVHAPVADDVATGRREAPSRVTSPWLRWVQQALDGSALDALHLVGHGFLSDEGGSVCVAESPTSNQQWYGVNVIGVAELAMFLNQSGAWAFGLSAPPANFSEAASRLFVDALTQARPGAALYHRLPADPQLDELGALWRFLFAIAPSAVPAMGESFLCCQPALVATQAPMSTLADRPELEAMVRMNASLFATSETPEAAAPPADGGRRADAVPNWVAAAQRYVEETASALQKASQDEQRVTARLPQSRRSAPRRGATTGIVEQTLRQAQEILAAAARRSTRGGTE